MKFVDDPLLEIEFGEGDFFAHGFGGLFESLLDDAVDGFARFFMGAELGIGPAGFVFLDQVSGADDFGAGGADHFNGAGVDHGNVGDGVFGRILHGDGLGTSENFAQIFL